MDDSKEDSHRVVHFEVNKNIVGKDNEITVQKKGNKLDVHLGFLQVNHQYKINFSIPRTLCQSTNNSQIILMDSQFDNPYLNFINATATKDTLSFQVELVAHQENLMVEEFCFRLSDMEEPFTVMLSARVLGKGQGTPLLKNEIHIMHGPEDDESDASSDFQGFD